MDYPLAPAAYPPYREPLPYPRMRNFTVADAAGAVFTANDAVYVPFEIDSQRKLIQMSVEVTVQSGNLDVAIYSAAGTRLVSLGSTAVGAAGIQVCNITDLLMARGRYYAALAVNNATVTFRECTPFGGASVGAAAMMGVRKQATAFPLPATATFAVPTRTTIPIISLDWE